MRLLALLAATLLSTLVLAGCSDNGGDGDGPSSSSSSSAAPTSSSSSSSTSRSSSSSSTSTTTAPPANRAPTGSISASAASGAIPLTVNFTLSGSDPDGDTLAWTLLFGDGASDDGAALPATVSHDYTAAGNFTAELTLSDGKAQSSYEVTITVAGAGAPQTLFTFTEATSAPGNPFISLEIPGVGWCGATCCAGFDAGMSGVDCVFVELPAGLDGHAFTATSDAGDPDVEFWATCDASELFSVADFRNVGPETGVVPGGAACLIMWDNAVPPTAPTFPTFTFTVV